MLPRVPRQREPRRHIRPNKVLGHDHVDRHICCARTYGHVDLTSSRARTHSRSCLLQVKSGRVRLLQWVGNCDEAAERDWNTTLECCCLGGSLVSSLPYYRCSTVQCAAGLESGLSKANKPQGTRAESRTAIEDMSWPSEAMRAAGGPFEVVDSAIPHFPPFHVYK